MNANQDYQHLKSFHVDEDKCLEAAKRADGGAECEHWVTLVWTNEKAQVTQTMSKTNIRELVIQRGGGRTTLLPGVSHNVRPWSAIYRHIML
jgi:hypothetical protein